MSRRLKICVECKKLKFIGGTKKRCKECRGQTAAKRIESDMPFSSELRRLINKD